MKKTIPIFEKRLLVKAAPLCSCEPLPTMMISKVLIILTLFLTACAESNSISNKASEEIAQNWTDKTRSYIIKTHVSESEENRSEFIKNTIHGIGIDTEKPLETEKITTTEIVAEDTNFIYIKKRRSNGLLYFDAITIKGSLYGTAEWFRENGNYERIGYYYNDIPCGKWKYYSSSNDVDSIVNFGNDSLLLKFELEPFLLEHLINTN